jgi:hypothetical protein
MHEMKVPFFESVLYNPTFSKVEIEDGLDNPERKNLSSPGQTDVQGESQSAGKSANATVRVTTSQTSIADAVFSALSPWIYTPQALLSDQQNNKSDTNPVTARRWPSAFYLIKRRLLVLVGFGYVSNYYHLVNDSMNPVESNGNYTTYVVRGTSSEINTRRELERIFTPDALNGFVLESPWTRSWSDAGKQVPTLIDYGVQTTPTVVNTLLSSLNPSTCDVMLDQSVNWLGNSSFILANPVMPDDESNFYTNRTLSAAVRIPARFPFGSWIKAALAILQKRNLLTGMFSAFIRLAVVTCRSSPAPIPLSPPPPTGQSGLGTLPLTTPPR